MSTQSTQSISSISTASFYGPPKTPKTVTSSRNLPTKGPTTAHSTPISLKASGSQPYSSSLPKRDKYFLDMAKETSRRFVGPMPVLSFLDEFLPMKDSKDPSVIRNRSFNGKIAPKVEKQMYQPFISAAEGFLSRDFTVVETADHGDPRCDKCCPDVAVYDTANMDKEKVTDFSKMEFWIEFKLSDTVDAFIDPSVDVTKDQRQLIAFDNGSMESKLTRGQIATYAAALLATQFRMFLFTILVCGNYARFLRWDRAGTIVSERFNYVEKPQLLGSFFTRYSQLDRRQRGHDLSVSKPSPKEIFEAKKALDLSMHDSDTTFVKLTVNHLGTESFCIAPTPRFHARSPMGRGSRAFTAYDITNGRLVFLKDYWRIVAPGMEKEGDVYIDLHKADVPHIPRFGGGDDVDAEHPTITQDWRLMEWACYTREMDLHTLYRMTLLDIGRDLTSFNSSWEYVNAIGDAVEAHWFAYKHARILHRDISVGNIIIAAGGKHGFLIDWDLCKRLPPLDGTSGALVRKISKPIFHRRPERTGTWQFIAAMLMIDSKHEHDLQDDLESFLWVLLWVSLRYTKHNLVPSTLSALLAAFDEILQDADASGGLLKRSFLLSNRFPKEVDFLGRAALNQLVAKLTKLFATRYADPFTKEELEMYDDFRAVSTNERFLPTQPIYLHEEKMKHLQSSSYVLDQIRAVTKARDAWPRNDKPVPQDVNPGHVSNNKRKRDADSIQSRRQVYSKTHISQDVKLSKDSGSDEDDNSAEDALPTSFVDRSSDRRRYNNDIEEDMEQDEEQDKEQDHEQDVKGKENMAEALESRA